MVQGLVWQVMGFIEDEQRVLRLRKNGATAQGQIRQHQVVIGHHHIGIVQILAGIKERTTVKVGAVPVGALAMISRHLTPDFIGNLFRPVIPVAVPVPGTITGKHVFKGGPATGFVVYRLIQQEQRHGIAVTMALIVQPRFQSRHTQVTTTAFGKSPAEIQLAVFTQVRQIFQNDLILKRHRGGGNHQSLAKGFRHRNGGDEVGQRFTCTGTSLHHAGSRRGSALAIVVGDLPHVPGNLRNHQALAITGTDILARQHIPIGLLNLLFNVLCQRHYLGLTQSRTVPTRKNWPFLLSTTPSSVIRSTNSGPKPSPGFR